MSVEKGQDRRLRPGKNHIVVQHPEDLVALVLLLFIAQGQMRSINKVLGLIQITSKKMLTGSSI
jgi:hypothetical protein